MDEADKIRLQKNQASLLEDLRVDDVLVYLIQEGVITDDDAERIKSEKTRRDRVQKLLSMLPYRYSKRILDHWRIHTQNFLAHAPPPTGPILSFLHTFSLKRARVGGPRPPQWVHAPPVGNPESAPVQDLNLANSFILAHNFTRKSNSTGLPRLQSLW